MMSSERTENLNRDWPGRAEVFRSFSGELDQEMVDQLDRAHTPSLTKTITLDVEEAERAADALDTVSSMRVRPATDADRAEWKLAGRLRDFVERFENSQ